MEVYHIKRALREFNGTTKYHKHLFPGKPALLITDGCHFIREECCAYWLFDAILSYQLDPVIKHVGFQIWEFRQSRKDLSWLLTCSEDSGKNPIISQRIEFSDFPIEEIKIWVIDRVALLPSEY